MAFGHVGLALVVATLLMFSRLHKRRNSNPNPPNNPETTITSNQESQSEPPSPSSSSSTEYEVFLSFRGPDTRTSFADYLYHDMIDAGIYVFRDNEELRVGEEIGSDLLQGIQKSTICIPIFSKGYASSRWCLRELAFMVECRRTRGLMVVPVFYDVTPYQVRNQKGTYGRAFSQHVKKYSKETVQQWRNALSEAGQLKGWELKKETDGHEGQLTKLIVRKVLRHLKKAYLLVPISIDNQAKATVDLLNIMLNFIMVGFISGLGSNPKPKRKLKLIG